MGRMVIGMEFPMEMLRGCPDGVGKDFKNGLFYGGREWTLSNAYLMDAGSRDGVPLTRNEYASAVCGTDIYMCRLTIKGDL